MMHKSVNQIALEASNKKVRSTFKALMKSIDPKSKQAYEEAYEEHRRLSIAVMLEKLNA